MRLAIHIAHNLIFLFFAICNLYGQEIPPIEKFSPEDYGGENQNWVISQAPNRFIYVGNNEGLLEYNGAKWKMYPSPNNTIIRAVHVVEDRIYTGCYMEFGYWVRDSIGELQYQSLVPKLKEKMVEDEQIWNIITYDEWVLFRSFNRIYFYNTNNDKYFIINSKNDIPKVFNIKNTIYYHVINEGIYKIEEGNPKLICDYPVFKKDKAINIFPIPDGLLIQTRDYGFYTLINNQVAEWDVPANDVLKKLNIFNSTQLKDKSFVLGTIKNGVIFLSKDGKIEYQIDKSNGLSNNTALYLFEDIDGNVWVGLDNGIDCINIKSPIRVFNDDQGKIGTIYTSILFNDFLYLGTNQGLFCKKNGTQEPFTFIEGTAGQVWCLFSYNDELFCGHHAGTFVVKKDEAILVSNALGTWGFRPIPNKENMLLQGNYIGLNVLTKEQGKWKLKNKIQGFENSVRYFEIANDNEIWISHGYKGVFKLIVDKNYTNVEKIFKDFNVPIGKNSSLAKYKNRILYAFENGIFEFNPIKNLFIKDTILSPLVLDSEYISGKLIVDETQKLWAFSKDNVSFAFTNDLTSKFKINRISIPASLRKGQIGYENISLLKNNNYLIGITDGYLLLDISQIIGDKDYNILLNSITIKSIGENDVNVDTKNQGKFDYAHNSVAFNYSVPEYDKYKIVEYQYKLIGQYDQWSDWTTKSELVFENLPFGTYNLNIRAKVGNKLSNNIISYGFIIDRPWYLSNMAIVVYLFVLLGITLITHKTYKKYYRNLHEHKQLESEQLIIRIKNEKLNEAIESKNRELAISTMSIIKKNEVLNNIKKELVVSNNKSNNDTVIELIDNNLNNTKDWEFFEKAFNNVDKDFLEKVKTQFPELTPNDLRFCAYLRLNLSSKEIAPLLNISVRSVETRRYRLRKRMGLDHNTSLVDYILKI